MITNIDGYIHHTLYRHVNLCDYLLSSMRFHAENVLFERTFRLFFSTSFAITRDEGKRRTENQQQLNGVIPRSSVGGTDIMRRSNNSSTGIQLIHDYLLYKISTSAVSVVNLYDAFPSDSLEPLRNGDNNAVKDAPYRKVVPEEAIQTVTRLFSSENVYRP